MSGHRLVLGCIFVLNGWLRADSCGPTAQNPADEDQVLFVSLGPSANDATLIIEAMGLPYEVRSRVTII